MTEEKRAELYEQCYECGDYGDDYSYDADTDSLISNCADCWVYAAAGGRLGVTR